MSLGREELQRIQEIKAKLEAARKQLEMAQRQGDLGKASELRYGLVPELEKSLPQEKGQEEDDDEAVLAHPGGRLLHEAVTPNDVAIVISKATGIPVSSMLRGDRERLLQLEQALESRIVGQNEAITAVANAVRLGRAGFNNPHRPIASFLFLGPTGVGKTELCKQLARQLFDSETALTRIDMSEYMEKFSVSRLIGAPPGYVGFDEGGQLTNAIRRKPYSVILLDEFEKAHREVCNLLLQVLDEGTLTDSQGVKVDFHNTIIIMTSNLGADLLAASPKHKDAIDEDSDIDVNTRAAVMDAVRHHFPPEFINRIDETVLFNRLSRANLEQIVEIRVTEICERLASKKINLQLTKEAKAQLAILGYDPAYGARPLQRLIQREILNPLASQTIAGTIPAGATVLVDASKRGSEVIFSLSPRVDSHSP